MKRERERETDRQTDRQTNQAKSDSDQGCCFFGLRKAKPFISVHGLFAPQLLITYHPTQAQSDQNLPGV